ncbi:unnamed protein product (macronuclear) [Paramecium tetraurelia]|uniref:Protein kinase domain-containing protein n=1 Tax=Paramecium tetraurelia TaxID=5888 RepID=A0E2H6_PARTE|nr:uncharacterized protein GSPATT00022665001 [Paramecium tetraurelia]CAK89493.1 unnamed protein product [Paramecium tetraurelia]|eukprot:XP_001456890.1 hypothetical protein (macronuclear) [Paramecium tetraurelia strain d4-2]
MQQIDQITLQGYEIEKYGQYLSSDQFKVYGAKIVSTGELVALKEQSQITMLEENLLRLQQLIKQQHIIEIKIFEIRNSKVFVIIEKVKKLFKDYILENEFKQKQQIEKCLLFLQIVQAIKEFHRFGIFHRNLKPINFVVCEDPNKSITVKLLDFGLIQFITGDDQNDLLQQGSIEYLAPEILELEQYYDKSVDVWSLGVIWYQMLTGFVLFQTNRNQLTQELINQSIEQNGQQIDMNIKNFIKQMLVIKSQERISLEVLVSQLQEVIQNKQSVMPQNQDLEQVDQLNHFKNNLKEQLDNQFNEKLEQAIQRKENYMKKVKIEIIEDEIYQTSNHLLNFQQQEINNYQLHATSERFPQQSLLDKWQSRDQQFMQFQEKYDAQIRQMMQKQEENIVKRWNEKSDQINRDIKLQVKQQLLLDYNLQMSIKENQIRGEQVPVPDGLIIIQNNNKQLDLLTKYLDNSCIKIQKTEKYDRIREKLNQIQQQLDVSRDTPSYQIAERNRNFQKELINIKIEIDSIEKEIELEYLANKLQRDKLNLQNKSQNLFRTYKGIVDTQILKLQQLSNSSTETNYNIYFNDKIEKLGRQKQNLEERLQSLLQNFQNQQIETLLPSFQKLKLFNENLNNIISQEEQSTLQLNSQQMVYQSQSLPILQQEIQDKINQQLDLLDSIHSQLQSTQICCTNINIIRNQQESKSELLQTLQLQNQELLECQKKLQENNLVIEENRERFSQQKYFNSLQIFSETNYEELTFKLKEIINLLELVKDRFRYFEDITFYEDIIDKWNKIKSYEQNLKNMIQETTESMQSYNNHQLEAQIDRMGVLIIQIKQGLQTIPTLIQFQRFNQEYEQNENNYLELFTLIIYIKQYHCFRYINRLLSLQNKTLSRKQNQTLSKAQIIQQNNLMQEIREYNQKRTRVHNLMQEYLTCLKRQREHFTIQQHQENNAFISNLNQELENKIKQKITVKLRSRINDQALVNAIVNKIQLFEFSPLLLYQQMATSFVIQCQQD